MVFAGKGSYIYWGIEGTALAGEPSSDTQIPFNPIVEIKVPKPVYREVEIFTFDKLVPSIIYTEELAPGEASITTVFRDPFFLMTYFTNKTVAGTWVSGSGTIAGDFTSVADVDTMWIQYHIEDQAANRSMEDHIDRLIKGILPIRYEWVIEPGKLLKEVITVKGLNFADNVEPMNAATAIHDDAFDVTAAYEISTITCKTAAEIGDGDYFYLYTATSTYGQTGYYCWFDKQGAGEADPGPITGFTELLFDISGATSANDVSLIVKTAIHALAGFSAADGQPVVTVTNAQYGNVTDIVDVDSLLTLAVTTQGALAVDGGWASWDDTGLPTGGNRSAADFVMEWPSGTAIDGLDIKTMNMAMDLGYETAQVASSLHHTKYWRMARGFTLTLTGILNNKEELEQAEMLYSAKTKQTLRLKYDNTGSEEKYIQVTNVYVATHEIVPIPPAGKAAEISLVLKGGVGFAISFSGAYDTLVDPDAYITD